MGNAQYQARAAEFNEQMGLSEAEDYWEDGLIRFSVIAEECGELMEAVNKDYDVGEELADVAITLYTGADTLGIEVPEGADIPDDFDFQFADTEREIASLVYASTRDIFLGILMNDEDLTRQSFKKSIYYCHIAADEFDVDLDAEFNSKLDHNMQKSGAKVKGKPVDDVDGSNG